MKTPKFFKALSLYKKMMSNHLFTKRLAVGCAALFLTFGVVNAAQAVTPPAQSPLFLSNPVVPIMVLNMSKDNQLYFKAYDDYSNITDPSGGAPDLAGNADTTYINAYDYYGYFDSAKCYTYNTTNSRFEPTRLAVSRYCNGSGFSNEWSGNFLNWASMTRIDVIRKILYGGYRSTDTATATVLERSFLPNDAHAFAKFYDGNDIAQLTPFNPPHMIANTPATGISICNTTLGAGYSEAVANPPLIRVAQGNYSLWGSNERWQCRWYSEKSGTDGTTVIASITYQNGSNGNYITAASGNNLPYNGIYPSGIYAYNENPVNANKLGLGDYNARVLACMSPLSATESPSGSYGDCYTYPSGNIKPVGLLQQFGESGQLLFGLMTGSFGKNKSGGVLRKNAGSMTDEINATTDGTFKAQPSTGGIIATINALRLHGYDYGDGTYNNDGIDKCSWGQSSFTEGTCSNWGNPQSEIYLESLRYLSGTTTKTTAFSTDDSTYFASLKSPAWVPPVTDTNYCAPINVLQFNASASTYDTDESTTKPYSTATAIAMSGGAADVKTWTDSVGTNDGLAGGKWFFGKLIGGTGGLIDQLCTAKTMDSLSNVSGTCPDSPRLDGSYNIAGLAYYARSKGFPVTGVTKVASKTVRTYGVALAPAVPKVEVVVPDGTNTKKVIIQPACQNTSIGGNCAIVDFKIVSQKTGVTLDAAYGVMSGTIATTGKLYVNWEDSEQGGDFDQDMWGIIDYAVTATKVYVRTKTVAESTPNAMGFGYVVSGTDDDGFHVQSGANDYINTTASGSLCKVNDDCTCNTSNSFGACDNLAVAKSQTFNVQLSSASSLQQPLYYAAQWGGYSSDFEKANNATAASLIAATKLRDPTGDSYYYATNPRALKDNLSNAFNQIAQDLGSASAAATNSTLLTTNTYLYQAQFNSTLWTGAIKAYAFDSAGVLSTVPSLDTDTSMFKTSVATDGTTRTVYTYNGTSLVNLAWGNLTSSQQTALRTTAEESNLPAKIDTGGQHRVDWLLGNATYETVAAGLRSRGTGTARNILGDIVDSSPIYVAAQNYHFETLPIGGSTYRTYMIGKTANTQMLYVGGNDGMVHAFAADTLKEQWAYIPTLAFGNSKLRNLSSIDYGKASNPHQFIVDGSIAVSDVYISGAWHTVLVGSMGAGAPGVYALDITVPASPVLLFELSTASFPGLGNLGYVMGKPLIVPMQNGRWAVVFGNGTASGTTSKLFVVDIAAPTDSTYTKVLDTGAGTGLSGADILLNSLGQAKTAYAGDLSGNLWRFNLNSSTPGSWAKDLLLYTATNGGTPQPITSAPTLGLNSSKGGDIMVYFGTGKYFDTGDNTALSLTHSFYAIADINSTVAKSSLLQKTITTVGTTSRTVSLTNPTWTTDNGWYMDFLPNGTGERVTTKALLLEDKLIFPTLIPSTSPCQFGGTSWIMEVPAVGDKFTSSHVLPTDLFNNYLVLNDMSLGLTKSGTVIGGELLGTGSNATNINDKLGLSNKLLGRQAWRQLH